jgi:hypothetical protein
MQQASFAHAPATSANTTHAGQAVEGQGIPARLHPAAETDDASGRVPAS